MSDGTKKIRFLWKVRDRGQVFYRGSVKTLLASKADRILAARDDKGNPVAEEIHDPPPEPEPEPPEAQPEVTENDEREELNDGN